jgi:hypothetical protein
MHAQLMCLDCALMFRVFPGTAVLVAGWRHSQIATYHDVYGLAAGLALCNLVRMKQAVPATWCDCLFAHRVCAPACV